MKKSELAELTRLGVRQKLEQVQDYLADLFKEFPEAFAAPTPPLFVRLPEKAGGNTWPSFTVSASEIESNGTEETVTKGRRATWTPERRAAASKRLKQQLRRRGPNVGGGQAWGTFQYQRIHDYLMTRPQRAASISEMEKALKIVGSSVLSAITQHKKDLFRKTGIKGTYQLKKIVPASQRQHSNGAAKKAVAHHTTKNKHSHPGAKTYPKHWGDSVWHRLHDYLHDQQDQTATLIDIMKDNKINSHASAITSMQSHADIFERVKTGVYRLTRVLTDDEKKQYLKP